MVLHQNSYAPASLQLGPDNKIYVALIEQTKLSVINNPTITGVNCNYQNYAIDLAGRECKSGLPNFCQSFFVPSTITLSSTCHGIASVFSVSSSQPIIAASWDFGDGNTSNSINPTHTYSTAGDYTVSVQITTALGTGNSSRVVTISPIPSIATIGIQNICMNASSETIHLKNSYDTLLLNGQNPALYQVSYYASQSDLNNNIAIANPQNFSIQSHQTYTIFAKVFPTQASNCSATTSFTLATYLKPALQNQPNVVICQNPYTGQHLFQLSQYNNILTNNNSLLSITYYASQTEAVQQLNPLPSAYTNTNTQEVIFYRLHHLLNPLCYSIGMFTLQVVAQPQVTTPATWYHCDLDTDGIISINLSQKDTEIRNGLSASQYTVSYYTTLQEANNNANALNPLFTNTQPQTTIYYRISHNQSNNCFATGSFLLVVSPDTVVNQLPIQYQCVADTSQAQSFNLSSFYPLLLGTQNPALYNISFHPSLLAAQNQTLAFSNPYQNTQLQETWHVRIARINNPNCIYFTTISINIQPKAVAHPVAPLTTCDSNNPTGFASFDLAQLIPNVLQNQSPTDYQIGFYASLQDASQGINILPLNFTNITNPQTIYAKVNNLNATNCFYTTAVQLIVYPKPYTNTTLQETVCDGVPKVLEVPSGFAAYTWNTGATTNSITITNPGNYWVDVTKNYTYNNCIGRLNFEVVASGKATITRIEKIEFSGAANQMTILASGLGDYEYSIDGFNYQDSPMFSNLEGGYYTIYVQDKKNCGVVSQLVALADAPPFFTPNGDSYNDYWNIKGIDRKNSSKTLISIYDRYGSLIQQINPTKQGWDGTYQGNPMPTSDYWYAIEWNGKIVKGHFSLKR